MNFFFITRCYRPDNIATIQQNLKDVFAGSVHDYKHCVVADLTHGKREDDFSGFYDLKTEILFSPTKIEGDTQNTFGMDTAVEKFAGDDDFVFVLDDDNFLHPRFLDVCDECTGDDACIVFKIENRPELGNPNKILVGNPVGHIDWANFIVKASVMKRLKVFHAGICEDGLFFQKLVSAGCSIHVVDKVLSYYNRSR